MRNILLQLLAYSVLSTQPLVADPSQPLTPGKPAGVRPAQQQNMVPIYGGVLFFGAILAVTIGVAGSSVATTATAAATATTS
jgi:hypothetical protein